MTETQESQGVEVESQSEGKDPKGVPSFHQDLHIKFIQALVKKTDSFEYVVMEHLKMSAVYWALMGMALMGRDLRAELGLDEIIEWVMTCQHPNGGFGGNIGHDPHLLYTLSAVQILALARRLDLIDRDQVASYVASLQQADGSFAGDEWGEIDTRFSYCALSTLAIIGRLHDQDPSLIDISAATSYVGRCRNFDGGFGCVPGAESHAGQVFTCVGALSIGHGIKELDEQLLGWWLCERQCDSGGLNGRPEKQADVCYSWWILSALSILGKMDWINRTKLQDFILACQDDEDGGIADRPGNMADVFHTFFGIAGLSLLGYFDVKEEAGNSKQQNEEEEEEEGGSKERARYKHYRAIDPVYALPKDLVEELGLQSQLL